MIINGVPSTSLRATAPIGDAVPTAVARAPSPAGATAPADFTTALADVASNAINVLKAGEASSISGIRGQMPVQQVVEAVMAAEQTLQATIAIRDKVVSAYLELSRMAI